MGRPAEFDRDEAIAAAVRVFARHGFEAASTADLLEAMGIARQSLYGAFGDKRRLFLEALRRYAEDSRERMRAALASKGPALNAFEAGVLVGLGDADDLESGCLGVGSIAEFGRSDVGISAVNDEASVAVTALFAARAAEGITSGELNAELDPGEVARLLLTLRSGLKVAVRGGASLAEARQILRLALRALVAR